MVSRCANLQKVRGDEEAVAMSFVKRCVYWKVFASQRWYIPSTRI